MPDAQSHTDAERPELPIRRRGLFASFRSAAWGLLSTISSQPHMRFHVTSAVMVMIVGMALPLGLDARMALLFCVALVFFAEILNTALEAFVDLHIREFARLAMVAKDAAAGGVLVLSVATVLILADILWTQWATVEASGLAIKRSLLFGLPLTAVVVVTLWLVRRWLLRLVCGLAAAGLAVPLMLHSTDLIFSIALGILILLAVVSRPRPLPADISG